MSVESSDRSEELTQQRAAAVTQLETAKKGWDACRRRSGAAAHKRSWYFESEMKKAQARIDQIDQELDELSRS